MQNEANSNDQRFYTVGILTASTFILLMVNIIGMYNTVTYWTIITEYTPLKFESCIKYELISRTIYEIFSCASGISLMVVCLFVIFSIDLFLEKFLEVFLYFNYLVFGPFLLMCCFLCMIYWKDVMYVCDREDLNSKVVSASNIISFIGALILSLIVTSFIGFYRIFILYVDSILRRPDGSYILRKIFWKVILNNRQPTEFLHQITNERQNNPNVNNSFQEIHDEHPA